MQRTKYMLLNKCPYISPGLSAHHLMHLGPLGDAFRASLDMQCTSPNVLDCQNCLIAGWIVIIG